MATEPFLTENLDVAANKAESGEHFFLLNNYSKAIDDLNTSCAYYALAVGNKDSQIGRPQVLYAAAIIKQVRLNSNAPPTDDLTTYDEQMLTNDEPYEPTKVFAEDDGEKLLHSDDDSTDEQAANRLKLAWEMLAVSSKILEERPDRVRYLCYCRLMLAEMKFENFQYKDAIADYEFAIDLLRSFRKPHRSPINWDYDLRIAERLYKKGLCHYELREYFKAFDCFSRSRGLLETDIRHNFFRKMLVTDKLLKKFAKMTGRIQKNREKEAEIQAREDMKQELLPRQLNFQQRQCQRHVDKFISKIGLAFEKAQRLGNIHPDDTEEPDDKWEYENLYCVEPSSDESEESDTDEEDVSVSHPKRRALA